jgi:hypothetical protein
MLVTVSRTPGDSVSEGKDVTSTQDAGDSTAKNSYK